MNFSHPLSHETQSPTACTMPAGLMAPCGELPSPDVGERLPDLRAALDPADTFDYFQAQGRLMRHHVGRTDTQEQQP